MDISRISGLLKTTTSSADRQSSAEGTAASTFQAVLNRAKNSEDAASAYENYMNGPERPVNNVCYLAEGVTFPPPDAPPEFLLAWNQTLNSMPPAESGLLCCHIMDTLEYGDYHGETADEATRVRIKAVRLETADNLHACRREIFHHQIGDVLRYIALPQTRCSVDSAGIGFGVGRMAGVQKYTHYDSSFGFGTSV